MEQTDSAAGESAFASLSRKYATLVSKHMELAEDVATMGETVRRLDIAAAERATKEQAPEVTGDALVRWVRWLAKRYELGTLIPGCWPKHGALVEELAGLYIAWLDAIDRSAAAATQWHEHLYRALDRIDGRWRACMDGTHRAKLSTDWLDQGPEGADDIDLDRDRLILD